MTVDHAEATSAELLQAAEDLLGKPMSGTRGLWPRTAAFLIRLALESYLDELWQSVQPGVADCPMRAQLLCLPTYVDEAFAQQAGAAWMALSRACHYHTYELPPTTSELRQWHGEVAALRAQQLGTGGKYTEEGSE